MTTGLKVYIHSDMEGVAGVTFMEDSKGKSIANFHREKMRRLMTEEVKAAVAGCLDAGAKVIYVNDSHDTGVNILYEELDPPVELIQGRGERRPGFMSCLDETFDAVVATGIFAMGGSKEACCCHAAYDVNDGKYQFSVYGLIASIAGYFNVPLIFASGDHVACKQMKKLVPNIEVAVVKQGLGFYNARSLAPRAARDLIRQGVARALSRRHEIKPFKMEGPYKVVGGDSLQTLNYDKIVKGDDWYEIVHRPSNGVFWGDFYNEVIDAYCYPENVF